MNYYMLKRLIYIKKLNFLSIKFICFLAAKINLND